jgi:hypothetical protein
VKKRVDLDLKCNFGVFGQFWKFSRVFQTDRTRGKGGGFLIYITSVRYLNDV